MKIYSGKRSIDGNALMREHFKIVSVDPKIIEQYGSVNEFIWQVFLDQVPLEMRKSRNIYYMDCYENELIKVYYNPYELNLQLLSDFFQKLGIEIKIDHDDEYDERDRQKREALFGGSDDAIEFFAEGPLAFSLFQITSEKHRNSAYLDGFEWESEQDMAEGGMLDDESYDENGLIRLRNWNYQRFIVCAEYAENQCTEADIVAYFKKRFDMDVKSDLD